MVKDTLNSMLDNIKERTTNPFLGTLLVVWIIRNWTLVYGLFNFDKGFTLDKKLKYIADHYQTQAFVPNLLIVVAITFLVLVSTYCMLTLGRLITDTYDKFVIPYLAKITDKSSIVLKRDYKSLEEVVKQLQGRLEEERIAKVNAQNERDKISDRLANYHPSEMLDDYIPAKSQNRIVSELKELSDFNIIDMLVDNILTGRSINMESPITKLLTREGIITLDEVKPRTSDYAFYKITTIGNGFLKYWNDNKKL
ncbi:hypothetical protein G7074_01665 [Pedobacter sp. HDW13]|uniref:hypothetical protein n=1 Tax=Pedobacter sp. HDW13 TaxID=2714940 RepID=UPI001409F1C2|nr:hypothetical protein [Pedobacter sp. HDW13]QIL38096.1 hypothetical protein G7074_01665 [Pedobacter sp. HDW13]